MHFFYLRYIGHLETFSSKFSWYLKCGDHPVSENAIHMYRTEIKTFFITVQDYRNGKFPCLVCITTPCIFNIYSRSSIKINVCLFFKKHEAENALNLKYVRNMLSLRMVKIW